jgi:hypothetical protein
LTALTDVENDLIEHVTRDDVLDLAGTEVVDEAVMRSWASHARSIGGRDQAC